MLEQQTGYGHGPAQNQPDEDPKYKASMSFAAIHSQFSFLEGKTLTVVDAAFSDTVQRKAVKDLIRGHFRDQLRHIEGIVFTKGGGVCIEASGNPFADSPA